MTEQQINEKQKAAGVYEMQTYILDGSVWSMEGSMGRAAMNGLETGEFYLPEKATQDFYGNHIPGRGALKPGSEGTLENSSDYWESVLDLID